MEFLEENSIEYVQQYGYGNENKRYKLDFYLPKYNIGIECQGIQHFIPTKFKYKDDDKASYLFSKTIERDFIKNEKCKELGIKLLYYTSEYLKSKISDKNEKLYTTYLYTSKNELLNEILK